MRKHYIILAILLTLGISINCVTLIFFKNKRKQVLKPLEPKQIESSWEGVKRIGNGTKFSKSKASQSASEKYMEMNSKEVLDMVTYTGTGENVERADERAGETKQLKYTPPEGMSLEYEDEVVTFLRGKDGSLWPVPTSIRESFLKTFTIEHFDDALRGDVYVIKEFGRPISYVRYATRLNLKAANQESQLEQILMTESDKLTPGEQERIKLEIKSLYEDPANLEIVPGYITSESGNPESPTLPKVEAVTWFETWYNGKKYLVIGP